MIRGNYLKETETDSEGRCIIKERETATYARAITIPGAVDANKINSSYAGSRTPLADPVVRT